MSKLLLAVFAYLCLGSTGCGRAPVDYGPGHAHVHLLADPPALVAGGAITLGIAIDLEPGWHTYWKGQNDTGYPIQVALELPEGFAAGEMQWPAPERHVSPGDILDHVYHDAVTLLVPVSVPPGIPPGDEVTLGATVDWLACRSECIPGKATVTLELPVVGSPEDLPGPDRKSEARLTAARAHLPRPAEGNGDRFTWAWENGTLRIEAAGAGGLAFYPEAEATPVAGLLANGETTGETLLLTPDVGTGAGTSGDRFRGVLAVFGGKPTDTVFFSLDLPLPVAATKETDP